MRLLQCFLGLFSIGIGYPWGWAEEVGEVVNTLFRSTWHVSPSPLLIVSLAGPPSSHAPSVTRGCIGVMNAGKDEIFLAAVELLWAGLV